MPPVKLKEPCPATTPEESTPAPPNDVKMAARSKPAPAVEDDWNDEDDDRSSGKGRQYRRDETHAPLQGLSKRERRKQRKLQRDAERAGQ